VRLPAQRAVKAVREPMDQYCGEADAQAVFKGKDHGRHTSLEQQLCRASWAHRLANSDKHGKLGLCFRPWLAVCCCSHAAVALRVPTILRVLHITHLTIARSWQ